MELRISDGNETLKRTDKVRFKIFNITARKTCPEAPEICKEICYAYSREKGNEIIVKDARSFNYKATKDIYIKKNDIVNNDIEIFSVDSIIREIELLYDSNKDSADIFFVRFREWRNFSGENEVEKWIQVASNFNNCNYPKLKFVAFTKKEYFDTIQFKPRNFKIINKIVNTKSKSSLSMSIDLLIKKQMEEGTFVSSMIERIKNSYKHSSKVPMYFRIHESGDFYSEKYFEKWVEIVNDFKSEEYKKLHFVAYTKQIKRISEFLKNKNLNINDINMKLIYSVMKISKYDDEAIDLKKSTSDESIKIAEELRQQSKNMIFYYVLGKDGSEIDENLKRNMFKCHMLEEINKENIKDMNLRYIPKGEPKEGEKDKVICSYCMECYEAKENEEDYKDIYTSVRK